MPIRFVTKFRNGIWQVFDNERYQAVRARPLFREAAADAEYLNSRPRRTQHGKLRP